jgi:hypothetical protein
MKNVGIFVIRNKTTGELWMTPKCKSSWGSVGAAKSAWNCHNWKKKEITYSWGGKGFTSTNMKWNEDAGDFEVKQVAELVYKELDND